MKLPDLRSFAKADTRHHVSMDNSTKGASLPFPLQGPPTPRTHTIFFNNLLLFGTRRISGKKIDGTRKETDGRTYEIPRTTLKIPQPPFLRMAEQTGHTIIDTHCVFGHFWTDQDQRSQGLRFCFFLLFVVFTGLSATTPTMGMEGVLVFCSLFCSNLLNLISLRSLFCVFTSATNLCYLPYCLSL
jgi:hypothetical protein